MTEMRDLTRWNRAGLSRFRYVDGNAATYLDELRAALAARFPEWRLLQGEPPDDETEARKLKRLLEQYHGERGDWGWEIARAFARACHVLTEHLDACANEGFLGTATQWDDVRRLVEMLDYSPAPPASASTLLALEAKEGKRGKVAKGFQVKYTPPEGGAPVIFETLEDVEVDSGLSELRLADYNRCPDAVPTGDTLTIEGPVKELELGQPVVLENERSGRLEARFLAGVEVGEDTTTLTLTLAPPLDRGSSFALGSTRVHLKPVERLAPLGPTATGATIERALQLEDRPPDLAGRVVFISDGVRSYYRRVRAVRGRRLVFYHDLGPLTLDNAWVSEAPMISVLCQDGRSVADGDDPRVQLIAVRTAGDLSRLLGSTVVDLITQDQNKELIPFKVFAAAYQPVDPEAPEAGGYTTLRLEDPDQQLSNPQALYVPPVARQWQVDAHLEKDDKNPLPVDLITESPKKIAAGDLAVVTSGGQIAWARLANLGLDRKEDQATLSVARWRHRGGGLFFPSETTVYSHFREQVRLAGGQQNTTRVAGAWLPLSDSVPTVLAPRCTLVLERFVSGVPTEIFETRVVAIHDRWLKVEPPLPASLGFTRENMVIRGNLVRAGHGELQPAKVLGSGDATRSSQSFVLEKAGVSFVADPTQPHGVRPDVEVMVGDRTWQQVPNLRDSGPADPHYTVHMTEDGHPRFAFGDGRHGRRLPTGGNNVRVTYRVGCGLAGNLEAGSLTKAVKPHPYVAAVHQPLPATGGNDMEPADSLRHSAPPSVLSLERAVSLADFAHLAARQSNVWQARAFPLATGFRWQENVEVVVVPAGGEPLGALATALRQYLRAHALPGVQITVRDFEPYPFDLEATVRIKTAEYDPEQVLDNLRQALLAAFSLRRRRLGQDLFLSEVYQVVEGMTGVESSECAIGGDPPRRRLEASDRQVLHLDPKHSSIRLTPEEIE
ncbi:MAG: hypothetical protein GY856_18440 [bacterium]|nr:hypothetical protein [bacterium]